MTQNGTIMRKVKLTDIVVDESYRGGGVNRAVGGGNNYSASTFTG